MVPSTAEGNCICKLFSSVEYASLAMCCFGMLLVFAGTLMRWRLDEPLGNQKLAAPRHGVQPLRNVWNIMGFDSKSYGLLTVHARDSRSWTLITHEVCASRPKKLRAEDCSQGFADHMYARCREYSKIYIAPCGIAYGMLLFSGLSMLVLDAVWALDLEAVTTWNAFTILGESAWFPYPSLAIGDGTVMWVVSEAQKHDVKTETSLRIGMVPLGTGNDFAQALGWGGRTLQQDWVRAESSIQDVWKVSLEVDEEDGFIYNKDKVMRNEEDGSFTKSLDIFMLLYCIMISLHFFCCVGQRVQRVLRGWVQQQRVH
eukprot:Skav214929  [mRNA]  locus=scaffold2309:43237:52995:+ [translate_table: standard]